MARIIPDVLYVDGACNKITGKKSWASITDKKGNCLMEYIDLSEFETKDVILPNNQNRKIINISFNDVVKQNNNGAELISMVIALRMAKQNDNVLAICSDSELIVKWWSQGHINAATLSKMDPLKKKYINECKKLRESFELRGGKIIKISGDDNPADLGYHK